MPRQDRIHDTMYLLFLDDPHAPSLSLKPSAERLLDMPPEERDAVHDWLYEKGIIRRQQKGWGAHIADAPGDIVGRYAKGDVERTLKLFKLLYPRVTGAGMTEAYVREQQLMPILLANEARGMRIDVELLARELVIYEAALKKADEWLRKRLGVKDLDFEKDRAVADALEVSGVVTEFNLTPTGQKSVAKGMLTPDMFNDQRVASVLGYRNRLTTCLTTFMRPWLERAASSGYIYPSWHQVRAGYGGSDGNGARTGRIICSNPNLLNIPKVFDDKGDGYVHPKFLASLPPLPLIRRYVLPDPGCVFGHRDYNQQELRILAHFEDGTLMQRYNDDPLLDVHNYVQALLKEQRGLELERRAVKALNFGMIYGMGAARLAESIGSTVEHARSIKAAQRAVLPGLGGIEATIRGAVKRGEPIWTWGGRAYYVEPPKLINGRMVDFTYKLLNYLIQGSAADCTKQAVINYDQMKKDGRFMVTVYDEINICAPDKSIKREMKLLAEAMQSVQFDVPMVTDGKIGPSWGALQKMEK